MGTVLQFAERLAEDGDWTPSERSQLRDMGAQLGQGGEGLDLVFGKTEEGDPWCVVADERSDVLLHVARIGGAFVVHAPRNEQVIESPDLWAAVSRVLGGVLRDRRGVIVPFPPEAMGQPAVLALMLAAAVRGDFDQIVREALPAPSPGDRAEATPMPAAPAQAAQIQTAQAQAIQAAQAALHSSHAAEARNDDAHLPALQPAHAAVAEIAAPAHAPPTPLEIRAQAMAVAAEAAPVARTAPNAGQPPGGGQSGGGQGGGQSGGGQSGHPSDGNTGAGPPATGGDFAATTPAPPAESPMRTVAIETGAVAKGEAGTADVFTLAVPLKVDAAMPVLLGVVSGFAASDGDRLVFADGATPVVVEVTALHPLSTTMAGETGRRIGYDLDGDGREDSYVVVLDAPAPMELHRAAATETTEPGVVLQGVPAAAHITITFIGQ